PRDPKTSEEGIVCHLYQNPDGRKVVRCAKVLDYPAEQVWAVVTDYEHFDEIFPTVESGKIQGKDKGRFQWNGEVTSLVGTWKVELDITHKESTDKKVASWKGTGEGVSVLEGSWTLTPAGPGKTLLVYTSDVELNRYPTFVVRNVLLSRQPTVLAAVDDW